MRLQLGLLGVAVAVAGLLSWLSPRLAVPPDRHAVAQQLLRSDRADEAVHLFKSHSWRGAAEYRAGRYSRALGEFFQEETVANFYNMGNAYARLHEWRAAKEAYRRALDLDPGHADAVHNLAIVERAEEQERVDREQAQATRRMGQWRDGHRTDPDPDPDPERGASASTDAEQGDATRGVMRPASAQRGTPGASDRQGRLGDRPTPGNREAGPAAGQPAGTERRL